MARYLDAMCVSGGGDGGRITCAFRRRAMLRARARKNKATHGPVRHARAACARSLHRNTPTRTSIARMDASAALDLITLTLPDGATREVPFGTLPRDVVASIGERLLRAAVA